MGLLDVAGLSAGYENGFVLHDVSFSVSPGEFVAVLGKNGSGKSTLVRAVQGLLRNVAGSVRLEGTETRRLSRRDLARKAAYVPQAAEPVFAFTVAEVVAMGRYAHQGRWSAASDRDAAAVEEALASTRLDGLRGKRVAQLSGGERQRVLIARALAQDAPLLVLDEPSAHLDIGYQVEIYGLLKELQAGRARTILAAEHNINLAAAHADRILFLKDGRVEALGPPRELVAADLIRRVFDAEVDIRANRATGLPEISLLPRPARTP